MTNTLKQTAKAGFTLVELAIVLVIIGLIVGGVLVGQDLIKAAEIRSTMADLESYNAAATTFRNKYNGLPGDLLASRASQYGMTTRTGAEGKGDGNSLMEGCAAGVPSLGCETALFWVDLTTAQLIPDAFSTATDAPVNAASAAALEPILPNTPLRDIAKVHVYTQAGRNYFAVTNFTTDASGVQAVINARAALTPAEASQIDEKADDGLPTTGIVRSITGFSANAVSVNAGGQPAASGQCIANDIITGTEQYNAANEDFAAELNCHIYYRASF